MDNKYYLDDRVNQYDLDYETVIRDLDYQTVVWQVLRHLSTPAVSHGHNT